MPRINNDGALESYQVSNLDSSGATKYFGFLDKYSNWYIMAVTDITAKYYRGSTYADYLLNWDENGHYIGNLEFDYYSNIF